MQQARLKSAVKTILDESDAISTAKASLRATIASRLLQRSAAAGADGISRNETKPKHDEALGIAADLLKYLGMAKTLSVLDAEYGTAFPVARTTLCQVRLKPVARSA